MSKKQNPFEGVPVEEIESTLESNCEDVVQKEYYRQFTPEERQAEQEHYQNSLTKKEAAEARLDEAKASYKEEAKPIIEDMTESRAAIRNNGRRILGKVYLMKDWGNNLIEEYDNRGGLITRRPMLPEEKQRSIKIDARDVSNL